MDALLDQIKAQAAMTDETGRRSIQNKLMDLQHSLEAPEDTMQRILYSVRHSSNSQYSHQRQSHHAILITARTNLVFRTT